MRHTAQRASVLVFAAAAALAAPPVLAGAHESTPRPTPRPTPTPAPCARPNVAAMITRVVPPVTPPGAEQVDDFQGTVQVVVSLDENSRLVGARIQSSPSALLNQAALAAVRASTFRTEIRDCRPLAADYLYTVEFQNTATFSTTASGERRVSVVGEGIVMRTADLAYIEADIVTSGVVATASAAQNDAAFAALNAKLIALGTAAHIVRDTFSLPAKEGYASFRSVEIEVANVANVERTAAAASSATSVTVVAIRFMLHDSAAAQREANDLALRDAEKSARAAVTGLRLGAVRQVVVPPNDRARPPVVVVPFRRVLVAGGLSQPQIGVPYLRIRATATVTYAVEP